jgi:DNA polymerase III epsilon subunit-like protein
MFTSGYCIDLETTIASKIPDHIRPKGQKRFETRIIEIGAVHLQKNRQWGCLVNPLPPSAVLRTPNDLFSLLRSMYQKPDATINFWSSVLLKRKSLCPNMFLHKEPPLVWSNRTTFNRAKDFVRWHNNPEIGPPFVTETQALRKLLTFTKDDPVWYAHNGRSFDFKILKGCAQRCGLTYNVKEIDTLREFRKCLPGHKSYSQPILYKALFNQTYNAHVAIDDAIALKRLCAYASGKPATATTENTTKNYTRHSPKSHITVKQPPTSHITVKQPPTSHITAKKRRPMNLSFKAGRPPPGIDVTKLRGIGPKTSRALAVEHIFTIKQLKTEFDKRGVQWLRKVLPKSVRWRVIAHSISSCMV